MSLAISVGHIHLQTALKATLRPPRLIPEIIFHLFVLPHLTFRQKEIDDFLLKDIREKGYAPSIPEIGAKFKIASTNGVSDHLKALGYIRRVRSFAMA